MAEVFINYRTGDGDESAELIQQYLSQRFGKEHVFKASWSIPPGEAYPSALLKGVRESSVLLAIMGPEWSRAAPLHDEHDWVRREILEAFDSAVRVIPILKGRRTERLVTADLPPELASLADMQSLRLDTRDSQADLARIGDTLADMVPSLMEADRTPAKSAPVDATANSATGPLAHSGSVAGNVNVFSGTSGPVHTGTGDIYPHQQSHPGENISE